MPVVVFDLRLVDTLKHVAMKRERKKKKSDRAEPQQDSKPPAVIFAGAAPPQNPEDLCTVFALPLLTPPASPLRRKTVLEYRFDHFVRVLSAALIPLSVQSVGPNPLMNVFSLPGGGGWWGGRLQMAAHSSAGARGGEQLERTPLLCLIPHLSRVAPCRAQFILRPVGGA